MKYYSILAGALQSIKCSISYSQRVGINAEIDGCLITNLKPVNKNAYGKTGNISLKGIFKGQNVKLFSMFSEEQVRLRQRVNKLSDEILLPDLIASEGRIVVEAWVDGTPAEQCSYNNKKDISNAIREYITCSYRFKSSIVDGYEGFDYLNYLEGRIRNWSFIKDVASFVDKWKILREEVSHEFVPALSNPDLAYQNFVLNRQSNLLYCIDNEFLHIGTGAYMDFYNSMIRYEQPPFLLTKNLAVFYRNTVKLRRIGSALIVGKPQQLNKDLLTFEDVE